MYFFFVYVYICIERGLNILSDEQILYEYQEAKRLEPIVMNRRLAEQNNAFHYPLLSHLFKLSDNELRKLSEIDSEDDISSYLSISSSSCSLDIENGEESHSHTVQNDKRNRKSSKKMKSQQRMEINNESLNQQTRGNLPFSTTKTIAATKSTKEDDCLSVTPTVNMDVDEEESPFKAPPTVTRLLERIGLRVKKWIYGDGNCFHRTVSYFLYETETRHREIRKKICEWLVKNWNRYVKLYKSTVLLNLELCVETNTTITKDNKMMLLCFLRLNTNPIGISKEKWIELQKKDGTWADQYSIIAAASCYNLEIITYQWERTKDGSGKLSTIPIVTKPLLSSYYSTMLQTETRSMYILNLKNTHFSLLEKFE